MPRTLQLKDVFQSKTHGEHLQNRADTRYAYLLFEPHASFMRDGKDENEKN
jgi:hypothetical protein